MRGKSSDRSRFAQVMYGETPKPAAETQAGQRRLRAYRLALGEFVEVFARAEIFMHFVLRWYTKTPAVIARVVFSGTRTDVAIAHLRRLAEAEVVEPVKWAELKPVIDQLGDINSARNRILHYGAEAVAEGEGFVTNALMAHVANKATYFPISPEILRDMTADLRNILFHLVRHMGRPALRGHHPEIDAALKAAWLYKQQPQPSPPYKTKSPRPSKRAPKSPRLPQSSQP
jgi:hypothetical protein